MIELLSSTHRNSITWDEDDHIYAGYMSWKHGDFGLNPEHPPMVKLVAALPLLNMQLTMPALQDRPFKIEAFLGGKDFFFKNDADRMLFRARVMASLFTLFLAVLVFLAAQEMFGTIAGFIALGLLVFDPNLLAHGAVVGTDAGLTCFMFASIYAFYRYVKAPSIARMVLVGVAVGIALACKHTGILIFPMLLLLATCELIRSADRGKTAKQMVVALVVISAISITLLWAAYGFRYAARPDGRQVNPPLASAIHSLSRAREVRLLETVARFKLLPESYLYGLADVRFMSDFYTSYLLGKIYPHGIWYYFPVAFVIKASLAFLLLLALAVWAIATGKLREWREILFLTIPPAFHLLIAMSAGMNIGIRHILPMFPFLWVLIGGAASVLIARNRKWVYAVAVLLMFQAISTSRVYPTYMVYANELWGGPSQTYKLLSDSNADWGQQLHAVNKYLDHHNVKDCWFLYFGEGVIDYHYYGIPCRPLPTQGSLWVREPANVPPAIDGTVLISAGNMSGFEFGPGPLNPYEQFKALKPKDVIEYSVFVFEGHFDVPLASSIGHSQKAGWLMEEKKPQEALAEAQQAVTLAPNAVGPNAQMGDILTELGRADEAHSYYVKALTLAKSVEPEFQMGWVEGLEKKAGARTANGE
jgi:4-amino-4-deoxy-L-arabinose transferase-like glycosyltransferase